MRKTIILLFFFIIGLFFLIYITVTRQADDKTVHTTVSNSLSEMKTEQGQTASQGVVPVSVTPTRTPYPTLPELTLTVDNAQSSTVASSVTSVVVSGKTLPGAYIILNEYELVAVNGVFSKTIALDEGENYVSIFAYTMDGASAEKEIVIVREINE